MHVAAIMQVVIWKELYSVKGNAASKNGIHK